MSILTQAVRYWRSLHNNLIRRQPCVPVLRCRSHCAKSHLFLAKHAALVVIVLFLVYGAFGGWYFTDAGLPEHFHGSVKDCEFAFCKYRTAYAQGYATALFVLMWTLLFLLEKPIAKVIVTRPFIFINGILVPIVCITSLPAIISFVVYSNSHKYLYYNYDLSAILFSLLAGFFVFLLSSTSAVLGVVWFHRLKTAIAPRIGKYAASALLLAITIVAVIWYRFNGQPDLAGGIILPICWLVSVSIFISVFWAPLSPVWTFMAASPFLVWIFNILPGPTLSGAIFAPIAYAVIVYCIINAVHEMGRYIVVFLFAVFFAYANSADYKYEFPGLEKLYPGSGSARDARDKERDNVNLPYTSPVGALDKWKVGGGQQKPKLVVLATSGGAYRATFWTATVLDKLLALDSAGKDLEGLKNSIRVVTGSSGGMVAGAYLVSPKKHWDNKDTAEVSPKLREPLFAKCGKEGQNGTLAQSIECDIALANTRNRWFDRGAPRDSLTAIAYQGISRDIPGSLFIHFSWKTAQDRGTVLEQQWNKLDVSFDEIAKKATAGEGPSIILSPVVAENGKPLLISNLDFKDLVPAQDKPDSMVFFNWFPEVWESFRLKTAVRMNSSFPLVSPSVALPTNPPFHIVDGGFYDNYGISSAVMYLSSPDVKNWIIENTSGVVVIQIRAFPPSSDQPTREIRTADYSPKFREMCLPAKPSAPNGAERALRGSFALIGTPLEAALATRESSMVFRNDKELSILKDLYNAERKAECKEPENDKQAHCIVDQHLAVIERHRPWPLRH